MWRDSRRTVKLAWFKKKGLKYPSVFHAILVYFSPGYRDRGLQEPREIYPPHFPRWLQNDSFHGFLFHRATCWFLPAGRDGGEEGMIQETIQILEIFPRNLASADGPHHFLPVFGLLRFHGDRTSRDSNVIHVSRLKIVLLIDSSPPSPSISSNFNRFVALDIRESNWKENNIVGRSFGKLETMDPRSIVVIKKKMCCRNLQRQEKHATR